MNKLPSKGKNRKRSNVRAVGVTPHGTPGARALGSPHGSDVRPYLTIEPTEPLDPLDHLWSLVRVDFVGSLALEERTTLAVCRDMADASQELAAWSHAMNLPWRDYKAPVSETWDPVVAWPPSW